MAACGSLQHIFENHLPENPTLIKSLSSWNQIKSMKPIELSFTDIFSELHFKDNPESSSSSSSSSSITDLNPQSEIEKINNNNADNNEKTKNPALDSLLSTQKNQYVGCYKRSDSFSSMNSESLQLCTEGLGFESFDDVEDLKSENSDDWQNHEIEKANIGHNHEREKANIAKYSSPDSPCREFRRLRTKGGDFPPPISCIGRSGKPGVCLKSYRHDGRFVLKVIRIPTQEFLHACREDGRLKLHFVQPEEEGEMEGEEEAEGEEETDHKEDDAVEQENDVGKEG